MKAAVYTQYGPPEVVQIKNISKPIPTKNQVLIKVHASTVNRTDCGFRSANYFVSRFFTGLFKPKYNVLGCEFAGEVVEIGQNVSRFKIGDKIFGYNDVQLGGHAEFICLSDKSAMTHIPEGMDFVTAAAMTEGAHYALNYVYATKSGPDKKMIVYGATGAIGSSAVQLLKHFGVDVTAVCATEHVDLLKSLGIDNVIDYKNEPLDKYGKDYDVFFDAVGKKSFAISKPLLKEGGIYVSTELGKGSQNVFLAIYGAFRKKKKRTIFPIPFTKQEDIDLLAKLASEDSFKPIIDRTYPLDEIVEAYRYVETGQKTGNVIIKISE